jgi:hypothetical protein
MRIRKVIQKPVKLDRDGIHFAGDVDAVINVNVNRGRGTTTSVSRRSVRIVQKGGSSRTYTGEEPKEVEQ